MLYAIYKARYFPHASFFEAKLGANPSYTRREIWEGRRVLFKGSRWRIGDGKIAKIWTNPWVPGFASLADCLVVHIEEMNEVTIKSLMDPCSKTLGMSHRSSTYSIHE